jgi:hypothetical protein
VIAKTPYALQEFKGAATLFWNAHEKSFSMSKMAAGVFGRNKQKKKAYV